jgi:Fic family protein
MYNSTKRRELMPFTPPLPTTIRGDISYELISLAEEVWIDSAKLSSIYSPQLLEGIRELLRKVNSYYSNRLESEGTHPVDIERAMRKDFDVDEKKRNLQQLSLSYIQTQKEIETLCSDKSFRPFTKEFILFVHKKLYEKEGMKAFLTIPLDRSGAQTLVMTPGQLREKDVAVGDHSAPAYDTLPGLFVSYENFYDKDLDRYTRAQKLIYAIAAHHKLAWIHPFLDGNGRASRLVLDGTLCYIGLEGYGLWNISRGLARNASEYQRYLSYADQKRQGDRDGRGQLSLKGLELYTQFMLETALDQIHYMSSILRLDTLSERIANYVVLSREGMYTVDPLPKYAEHLFKELLIRGELSRGEVRHIIGAGETTARNLVRKLLAMEYLETDSPKGVIRMKFNSYFASKIFPDLIPDRE